MTPRPDADSAEVAAVETDPPCARCGYNLRGLKPDGQCPECGSSVAQSLQGNLLRFAHPDWLDKLRLGTTLMIWNIIISVVASISTSVFLASGLPPIYLATIGMIGSAIGVAAAILVTTPEPSVIPGEDPVTLRKVVRMAAVLSFLGDGVQLAGHVAGLGTVVILAGQVLSLASVVYGFALLAYFRRLALRVPDESLARSTRMLMRSMIICAVIGVPAIVLVGAMAAPNVRTAAMGGILAVVCVGSIALLILCIWYIAIIAKYNSRFSEIAELSRANEAARISV